MDELDSFADKILQSLSVRVASRSTRRSFLGKAVGTVFGLMGFELVRASPVITQEPDALAQAWQRCGAYGYLCGTDCGTGDDFNCPSNCLKGSFWHACCPTGNKLLPFVEVNYYDCFLGSGMRPGCGPKRTETKGAGCVVTTDPKPEYRDGFTGLYCCTILLVTAIACTDP